VTKPETDFVDDDREMARRAAWLLGGHPPGREQLPLDLDLNRIYGAVGADGLLKPLAHFAMTRTHDATRAAGNVPVREPQQGDQAIVTAAVAESMLRSRMQAEASVDEKHANDQLREGRLHVRNAINHWLAASEKRADDYRRIPIALLTGEHQGVLAEVLAAGEAIDKALSVMDGAMRRVAPDGTSERFPSTLGLPKAERNVSLNAQALLLYEAGHTPEEIAFVMGWDAGTPAQIRDRTRKRLEEARSVTAGATIKGSG